MKTCIISTTLFLLLSIAVQSQDLTGSSNTFVRFSVVFTGILDKLDPYEVKTKKETDLLKKNRSKLNQMLHDEMYRYFIEKLQEKQIGTEDIAVLTDRGVIYLKEGYPNPMSAKSAIKKSKKKGYSSDYFLDVRISVGETLDVLGGKLTRQVKPISSVTINVLDKDGNKIKKVDESVKGDNRLKSTQIISGGGFNKLESDHYPLLVNSLHPIMQECVDAAISQL